MDPNETVSEFVRRNGLGERFESSFLLPLGSALWSCSIDASEHSLWNSSPTSFPIIRCFRHYNRPVWRVLKGGSRTYVDKIVESLGDRLHLSTAVRSVRDLTMA